ncbi:methyltransferase domain-containing protein [bacterium]|nr:methyltransferase domain-containing protein [bacterium]
MEKTEQVGHSHAHPRGVMDAEYHQDRLKSPGPRYRFKRRGLEVARILQTFGPHNPSILDIGTADGLLLDLVCEKVRPSIAIGLDLSWGLLKSNTRNQQILQADAERLPFPDSHFDAAIATAIIEHLPNPTRFIEEIKRVLKPGGICVITTPVPLFEEIASKLGFLKEDDHQETFNLKGLTSLIASKEFQILESEKFMMSPVGFPAELSIEKVIKKIGLSAILLNQLVAARKP